MRLTTRGHCQSLHAICTVSGPCCRCREFELCHCSHIRCWKCSDILRDSLVSLACFLPPRNMRTMCGTDRRVAKKEKYSEHYSQKKLWRSIFLPEDQILSITHLLVFPLGLLETTEPFHFLEWDKFTDYINLSMCWEQAVQSNLSKCS